MISIRHANIKEKRKTYEWLSLSDTAQLHMGYPDYPEAPIPNWNEYNKDFEDFYFEESGREAGSVMIISKGIEEIGCLCYACFHLTDNTAELDIWLKSQLYCGKGYGPVALSQLVKYLSESHRIKRFIIRPSEKNKRAIRSYEKVGFTYRSNKERVIREYLREEYRLKYGNGDYGLSGTAVLTKEV